MIELDFQKISESLKQFAFPAVDVVVGIGTGGIVPACLVAHQLNCELQIIVLNHRNSENQIVQAQPIVISTPTTPLPAGSRVLLVDDVSVTGKTLASARELLEGNEVVTFALKGKADLVLFPDLSECVAWPWKT
jgi:hypoxanthine phosphoribosyltransferase